MSGYTTGQRRYIQSVDGRAHQQAVEIIGASERERDDARAEIERLRRELEWKAEVVELPDKHPLRAERDEVVALLLACQEVLMNLVHYSDDDHAPSALLARLDAFLAGEGAR